MAALVHLSSKKIKHKSSSLSWYLLKSFLRSYNTDQICKRGADPLISVIATMCGSWSIWAPFEITFQFYVYKVTLRIFTVCGKLTNNPRLYVQAKNGIHHA
jgi:hypothetical protein